MKPCLTLILAVAVAPLCAHPALAQAEPAPPAQTYALTPEQKDRLAATSTESSAEAARLGQGGGGPQIHGEVGAMIGTGGARGLYGTAAIPLGENGGAIVSFEHSRFGDRRR